MKRFFTIMQGIGFVMILLGMGAMDSDSIVIPIVILAIGITLFALSAYLEDEFFWDYGRREDK